MSIIIQRFVDKFAVYVIIIVNRRLLPLSGRRKAIVLPRWNYIGYVHNLHIAFLFVQIAINIFRFWNITIDSRPCIILRRTMARNELHLYRIDIKYIRELHKICDHVPSVSPQLGKDNRHFIGIVVMINNRMYAIPITRHDGKPKKRKTLQNNDGYTKVVTDTGRFVSGINFIDMIPITPKQLLPMDDYSIKNSDSRLEKARKRDLKYISDYVSNNEHSREISDKAIALYNRYINNEQFKTRKYCLPFDELEVVCDKYNTKLRKKD